MWFGFIATYYTQRENLAQTNQAPALSSARNVVIYYLDIDKFNIPLNPVLQKISSLLNQLTLSSISQNVYAPRVQIPTKIRNHVMPCHAIDFQLKNFPLTQHHPLNRCIFHNTIQPTLKCLIKTKYENPFRTFILY